MHILQSSHAICEHSDRSQTWPDGFARFDAMQNSNELNGLNLYQHYKLPVPKVDLNNRVVSKTEKVALQILFMKKMSDWKLPEQLCWPARIPENIFEKCVLSQQKQVPYTSHWSAHLPCSTRCSDERLRMGQRSARLVFLGKRGAVEGMM